MRASLAIVLGSIAVVAAGWSAGCATADDGSGFGGLPGSGSPGSGSPNSAGSPGSPGGTQSALCPACVTDRDCNGGVCAQFQGDIYCAAACPNGDECTSGRTCTPVSSASGQQVSVCVPNNNACGPSIGPGAPHPGTDGGSPPPPPPPGCDAGASNPDVCGTYIGPNGQAGCQSCSSSSSSCQPNGCYGGWWCDTSTNKCHAPPSNCPPPSGGTCGGGGGVDAGGGGVPVDAGGPVTGSVGPNGGTVSRLYFTVVGDTRPPNIDDTSGYPTAIINAIYADIAALSPVPPFSISTGDYMFASTGGGQSGTQLDMYLQARATFPGQFFPAMGNHECTGATASNCGPGGTNGITQNYTDFLTKLLGPLGQQNPYYSININAADGSWTSKFVFTAANAWDSSQSSWLAGVMAQATTYTFVVRHESTSAGTAPGVSPIDQIISGYPYTMKIVGHSHTYGQGGTKEVIFGNGGAPLTGSGNYGFALVQQRSDGAIQFDMIDYQSHQPDASFTFAVKADGSPAP